MGLVMGCSECGNEPLCTIQGEELGLVMGCSECGNEPLCTIQGEEFCH